MNNRAKIKENRKNESIASNIVLFSRLFSNRVPLNQKIIFFITNASDDESIGSSLYFVNPHGTIRCRSDITRSDRPPIVTINPYMVGYYKPGEQAGKIKIIEAAVGLHPFETEAMSLDYLNRVKDSGMRLQHYGHIITELVSLEQLNDLNFKPKSWVNREEVGLLWSAAVNQIKNAETSACLDINGYYIQDEIVIPVKKKLIKCGCNIS